MHKNALKVVWGVKIFGLFGKKIMCAFFVRVSVGFGKIGALLNSKVLGTLDVVPLVVVIDTSRTTEHPSRDALAIMGLICH